MTDRLNISEAAAVDGFIIGKVVSVSDESALYEIEFSEAPHRTVLELRQGDTDEAKHRLATWHETARLSHPHLLQLHAAGSSVLNEEPVIYAVFERADESLAEALSARTLSHEEASEILRPALSALDYLHKNGYAAARLPPSKIVAVGSTLKLSTDQLERIADGGDPASDMWDFGALLAQSVTGVAPQRDAEGVPFISEGALIPLGEIVQHCLDANRQTRWTAEEALASLEQRTERRVVSDPAPVREEVLSKPAGIDEPPPPMHNRRAIYVAVAAVLFSLALIGGLAWHRSKSSEIVAVAPPTPAPAPVAQESPAPAATASKPEAFAPIAGHRSNSWVVVIASYAARVPAEKRVREIAKKWPKFHVELFEAASEKTHLLVVIGKNLTEKEAEALRSRARSAGLPRDTYIKRIATGNG